MSAIVLVPIDDARPPPSSFAWTLSACAGAMRRMLPDRAFVRDYYLLPAVHRVTYLVHLTTHRRNRIMEPDPVLSIRRAASSDGLSIHFIPPPRKASPLLSGHLALARIAPLPDDDALPCLVTTTCAAFQPSEAPMIPCITVTSAPPTPASIEIKQKRHWTEDEDEAFRRELSGDDVGSAPRADGADQGDPFLVDLLPPSLALVNLPQVPRSADLVSLCDSEDFQLRTPSSPLEVHLHSQLHKAVRAMSLEKVWTYIEDEGDTAIVRISLPKHLKRQTLSSALSTSPLSPSKRISRRRTRDTTPKPRSSSQKKGVVRRTSAV